MEFFLFFFIKNTNYYKMPNNNIFLKKPIREIIETFVFIEHSNKIMKTSNAHDILY